MHLQPAIGRRARDIFPKKTVIKARFRSSVAIGGIDHMADPGPEDGGIAHGTGLAGGIENGTIEGK